MEKTNENEKFFVFDRPVTEQEILHLAKDIAASRFIRAGPEISSSQLAGDFLNHLIGNDEREFFVVIFLDVRHRIIAYEQLFQGTIHSSPVYPREIIKRVLYHNAGAVILAHNHPSGDPTPSDKDRQVTSLVKDALSFIETRLLDHLIIAGSKWFSFADEGIL